MACSSTNVLMFRTRICQKVGQIRCAINSHTCQRRFVFYIDVFVFTVSLNGFSETSKASHFVKSNMVIFYLGESAEG